MKYAILVPALNEAAALPGLFERLGAAGIDARSVLVVDNGSTDGTASIARELGARVVSEPRRGYGRACLTGIARLREATLREDDPIEALVFMDADDFTAPARLADLLEPIAADAADLVIGERVSADDPGVRWHARLGNRLVLAVMRALYGSRVRDMGPFRAIRWSTLEALELDDPDYGWYVQMQVRALRRGARVIGMPVEFARRSVGRSKVSGNPLASARAGWVMLRTLAVEALRRSP